jgi:hypothetical protein
MGVSLYFVKPDASGRVIFPCWDVDGVEYTCSAASGKFAMGNPRFAEFGLLSSDPIPPDVLVGGARRALRSLLLEVAAFHPDFRAFADGAGDDVEEVEGLLGAFDTSQDMGGWRRRGEGSRVGAFTAAGVRRSMGADP